jgi:hypothetical protein
MLSFMCYLVFVFDRHYNTLRLYPPSIGAAKPLHRSYCYEQRNFRKWENVGSWRTT